MAANPLYQDIILEHFEYPRGKGMLTPADAVSRGHNPACGDDLLISLRLDSAGERVEALRWDGHACAICQASASMMAEALEGRTTAGARRWSATVCGLLTRRPVAVDESLDLADLRALEGVKDFPLRVKCALLGWEALDEALRSARREAGTAPATPAGDERAAAARQASQ